MRWLLAIACLLLLSCSRVGGHSSEGTSNVLTNGWQKKYWIEKTARLLRNGKGADSKEIDLLSDLPEREILQKLMRSPEFGDSILDFNMYFLGFKIDSIRMKNQFSYLVYEYPNAVAAAQEAIKDGDFFKLFNLSGSIYLAPLSTLPPNANDPSEVALPTGEVRKKRLTEFSKSFQNILDSVKQGTISTQDLCKQIKDINENTKLKGTSYQISFTLLNATILDDSWTEELLNICSKPSTLTDFVKPLETLIGKNMNFIEEVLAFENQRYQPSNVTEIKAVNLPRIGVTKPLLQFGFEQALALPNSITNFNRKRSAYILSRYFCDDLTPIGVEDPGQHTGGPHGSDPACYSCHYKLDPMAGFFRNYGAAFKSFEKQSKLTFDDGSQVDRENYELNWKAPAGSTRQWEVGYVRSVSSPKENLYGESIDDLSGILRQAPEVKRCVVKRLFEYYVARDQTIDAGFLNFLTEQFERESKINSAIAFKNVIQNLLLSKSFITRNLDPNECYDFAPGADIRNTPPCRVAFLFEKNCKQCHQSTSVNGRLDLSRWITLPDGTKTFPHLDRPNGSQLPPRITFNSIIERLSTPDINLRMPKNKTMTSQDRQELYLWTQEMANKVSRTSGGRNEE